jgi:hypothetical protein
MTDMYWTITIEHKTVVYLTLNFHPKGESTALTYFATGSKVACTLQSSTGPAGNMTVL